MERTVKVTVTTMDGELLDQCTVDLALGRRYVAVRDVNYSMGAHPNEQVLDCGERYLWDKTQDQQ